MKTGKSDSETFSPLPKARTGIAGLDEITFGGLPAGRPTLVCGGPGTGKTMLAMHFLVNGATDYGEPGLFVSFEESPESLTDNFKSQREDFTDILKNNLFAIEHIDTSDELIEAGDFNLDALLIRLEMAIAGIGAKRLVIDTFETIFTALADTTRLRHEFARLFHWLRDRGITCVITGERGKDSLSRYGFEEYISDCVIVLDLRVRDQISRRRLRIIKYRGSAHGKDEYPFLIDEAGIAVLPITSIELDYESSSERVSTGFKDLDQMFGGPGYFRGSSILISGKAGTGKSTLAAAFIAGACRRGERCLYYSFEESPAQLIRNMSSVGVDFKPYIEKKLLSLKSLRPTYIGLEEHLVDIIKVVDLIDPVCMVMDPISNFISIGSADEVKSMLIRIIDYLKAKGVTLLATSLTPGSGIADETETNVSSLMDIWIGVEQKHAGSSHFRELYIIKSRGMKHSHEIRELIMSEKGLSLNPLAKQERGVATG